MKKVILLASALLCFLKLIKAQNGEPDPSFGTNGIVKTQFTDTTVYNSTATQSDGKIVVAGYTWNGRNYDFLLVRYNTDGSLDNTFSGDGEHKTGFGSANDYAYSVAVQIDGKIVVAGSSNHRFALARYNIDGSLDNTFSGDGKQIDSDGSSIRSVAIQNGKIVVAGVANQAFAVARYTASGSLDNSFSGDGIQTTDFGTFSGYAQYASSIAIQSDNKIVAAGTAGEKFAVARYNSDGSLDQTFSEDGKQTTKAGEVSSQANSVAVQKDGKIVVEGEITGEETNGGFAIVRYNTDGSLDNTFSGDGILRDYHFNFINSIAIQSDGKIVGGGFVQGQDEVVPNFAIFRFRNDGRPDSSFNHDGIQITEISGVYKYSSTAVASIAIANNKLYAAGTSSSPDYLGIVTSYLLDNSNNAPTVSISIPNNVLLYSAPARIKINAVASDKNGTISKVQFYSGNTLLHTEDVFPYGYLWLDVPVGKYAITAKAYDNDGFSSTSNTINVSLVYTFPPVVKLVSPASNTTYTTPDPIRFVAQAKDRDGKISKVKFYIQTSNKTLLTRTEYYYPYTYTWTNAKPGKYHIWVSATDDKGAQAHDAVGIIVQARDEPVIGRRPSFVNSLTDLKNAGGLKLSPNPAGKTLQVYTNGFPQNKPLTISVISASGVLIKTIQSNASNKVVQLDVSSMVSGVYTIKVVSGYKFMSKQFVKL